MTIEMIPTKKAEPNVIKTRKYIKKEILDLLVNHEKNKQYNLLLRQNIYQKRHYK